MSMDGMPMPGGWTMSMVWMRMPGQTWLGAEAMFVGMWVSMMAAMMLPSLLPVLSRHQRAMARLGTARPRELTAMVGVGYLSVWAAIGAAIYPVGAVMAAVAMRLPSVARAVPIAAGVVVLLAGALQFTAWKAHHLVCCRDVARRGSTQPSSVATAWRQGVRLGVHCSASSAGLTSVLLVLGVMDLRAMAAVTVAITAERLLPTGERVARVVGWLVVGAGLFMVAAGS